MSKLATKLKKKGVKRRKKRKGFLWQGPHSDDPQGGVTQSMLKRFMMCRERFRIHALEGIGTPDNFKAAIEYGNFWHIGEEHYEEGDWEKEALNYAKELAEKYPSAAVDVDKWYKVFLCQFPIYMSYVYDNYPEGKPLLREQSFSVPYTLPSGMVVYLRGKWDGVTRYEDGVWSVEHKSKGSPNAEQIGRQLLFDLQTMFYHVALQTAHPDGFDGEHVQGVVYNVVKRPLSGGKGSIRQHKPTKSKPQGESEEEFYERLAGIIEENEDEYFMRWDVTITQQDVDRFKREFMNPMLEQLCLWWEDMNKWPNDPWKSPMHYRFPYGIYSPLCDGRSTGPTDFEEYLRDGSTLGLRQLETLFPEL